MFFPSMTSRYDAVGLTSGLQANSSGAVRDTGSPISLGGPWHLGTQGRVRFRSQDDRESRWQSQCQRLPCRVRSLEQKKNNRRRINKLRSMLPRRNIRTVLAELVWSTFGVASYFSPFFTFQVSCLFQIYCPTFCSFVNMTQHLVNNCTFGSSNMSSGAERKVNF